MQIPLRYICTGYLHPFVPPAAARTGASWHHWSVLAAGGSNHQWSRTAYGGSAPFLVTGSAI